MKNIAKKLTALAVTGAIALLAGTVYAQPGGGAGGGRGGFALDDQQRTALREAMAKNTEATQALQDKLTAAQKELMKVVLAEKQDEKAVKEKAEVVAKIQTEMICLNAKAWGTITPTLKEDQRTQMIDSRFGVMMLQGGMGGGMRGGPGAPGGGPGGQGGGQGGGRGNRGGGGGGAPGGK